MGMKTIRASKPGEMGDAPDLACILIDGEDPVRQPLRVWGAKDIEALEIYPSGTEVTGTVAARFRENECRPIQDPRHPAELIHPTYYVLWRKK
jgi:hypothetical protein